MSQKINIPEKIKYFIHHIDRKQTKLLDSLKHYSTLYQENEPKHSEKNQDVITNIVKTAMNYYMKIKHHDRVGNAILSIINEECLTIESVEFLLEVLYNNIMIEFIFNDNKKLVTFISNVIQQTIGMKLHSKYIIENFKLLVDLYTVTPSNDSLERQLYKIKQDYITSLFTLYGLSDTTNQLQSLYSTNQATTNSFVANTNSPHKTPTIVLRNVNGTPTSSFSSEDQNANSFPQSPVSPLFSVQSNSLSRKIIPNQQTVTTSLASSEGDNHDLNVSFPPKQEIDIITQEIGKEKDTINEKRASTRLKVESFEVINNYVGGEDDELYEEEIGSLSDTESMKMEEEIQSKQGSLQSQGSPQQMDSNDPSICSIPETTPLTEEEQKEMAKRMTIGLSNETIQSIVSENVHKILNYEMEETKQDEIESEIDAIVAQQTLQEQTKKEQEQKQIAESLLQPHYLLLQIFTKISTEEHRKMFVISETLLRGNYRQMTGKRALTLKMERMVLNLVEFWLSRCPNSISPIFIDGWNVDLCKLITKNAFSNEKLTFNITLKIFINVIKRFRKPFKREIAYILKYVYFYYLKSPLPYIHFKKDILEELQKFATDPALISELFLNYDCDEQGLDLFEEMLWIVDYVLSPQFKTEILEELQSKNINESRRMVYKLMQSLVTTNVTQYQTIMKIKEVGMNSIIDGTPSNTPSTQAIDLLQQRERKRNIVKFKELFKEKPKDGIKFLIDSKMCESSPESIAIYLYVTEGLDKTALGKYLTTKNDFNETVFSKYVELIDFSGLSVDEGLRKMFNLFVMPGEGQVVDRVMEVFSKRYAECWSKKMKELKIDNTHVYFIATTIIFLSTETHNANVKTRTMDTYDKFKGMIEQFGFTLPDDYLFPLYESVTQNAFLIPKEQSSDEINATEKLNIGIVRVNPTRREELLSQGCQINNYMGKIIPTTLYQSDTPIDPSNIVVSVVSEDILRALMDCAIPVLMKSMKVAFEEYGTIDVAKLMKQLVNLCVDLKLKQSVEMIMQAMCENCLYYKPTSKQKIHIEMTRVVIDLAMTMKQHLYGGWKYVFTLLSHLELVGIYDMKVIPPLTTIPKNTRKLFFMEIEHKLYQPKPNVFPTISQSGILLARKELKEWLEKGVSLFEHLLTVPAEDYEVVVESLCQVALEELNIVTPTTILLNKLIYMSYERKNKHNLEITEKTSKMIFDFLLQCGLHPHYDIARMAISSVFILNEFGFLKDKSQRMKPLIVIACDSPVKESRMYVIQTIKDCMEKNIIFISKYWKDVFRILHIASMDEDRHIVKEGYEIMKFINQKNIQFDKNCYQYYLNCCSQYLLVYERLKTKDLESISLLMNSITLLLDSFKETGVNFTHNSQFNQVFMNVLQTYRKIIMSDNLNIASMAFQSINQLVDEYIDILPLENWYVIVYEVYVKILEIIGYYHKQNDSKIEETKNTEWMTSIVLNLLLKLSQFISSLPSMLSFFVYDFIYIVTTFIIKGQEFVSHVGILALKDIINYLISSPSLINIFVLMNNDIMNYFFDAVLSFTLQQNSLMNEIEKERETPRKKDEEVICHVCKRSILPFDHIQCPVCLLNFCSTECQQQSGNHEENVLQTTEISDSQFVSHKFELTRLDIPFITNQFNKYIETFFDYTNTIVKVSEEANENILNCLIFNVERFLNIVDQTKTGNTYLKYVKDLTNNVQKILIQFAKQVFQTHPKVFIKLVGKFLQIQSNTIIHFAFDLLNEVDESLLLEMSQTQMPVLYKLILHEDIDVRKSLSNLLLRIDKLIHSSQQK